MSKKKSHGARVKRGDVDFEKAFNRGHKSYDTVVGDWWESRASNGAHRKAYLKVTEEMRAHFSREKKSPRWIVDYACGSGYFLEALAAAFPKARIVALDGSLKMLGRAQDRLARARHEAGFVDARRSFDVSGPRIRLVKTRLPNFSLPQGKADAVAFLFPNLSCGKGDQAYYDRHGYRLREDTAVCKVLSRLREMDPEDEVSKAPPDEWFDGLMSERVIARNVRGLLRRKGAWFKVDYANARREDLSHLTNIRSLFGEGALTEKVKDLKCASFFRYLRNRFHRSQVILDVYHQTKDASDRTGGYFISAFEAQGRK